MAIRLLCISLLTILTSGKAEPNHNQPLDRPFTLSTRTPFLLEAEYHRMAEGELARTLIFPRPCRSAIDSSRVCRDLGGWRYRDTARARSLAVSPVAGYEYRYREEHSQAADFGMLASGYTGPVSFHLDARMYTEIHDRWDHASFDREFVERQDEKASGSVAYTSYSRYRSDLSYDWDWGRLTVARDAAHWGPGQFTNLVFNHKAVPFNQLTFSTHLGPLTVQSLYGQLLPDTNWESDTSSTRSLYAHRYEWRVTKNLLLGGSEQLILYRQSAPFAFVPLVPLYITKASEKEVLNNGNIAVDASYRFPGWGSLYSEFLIDDIQSPTSLFNENWGNKWAWMAGGHLIGRWGSRQTGFIAEYSRLEPWVYTHKTPHTAQTANFGQPLGNPLGPNSQTLVLKGYLRAADAWYASLRLDLSWKGTDSGSSIDDIHGNRESKEFLAGVERPDYMMLPMVWFRWKGIMAFGELGLGTRLESRVGFQYQY